ncbi:hypothetical protein JCM5353_007182 [Sporobolomyces roseus]
MSRQLTGGPPDRSPYVHRAAYESSTPLSPSSNGSTSSLNGQFDPSSLPPITTSSTALTSPTMSPISPEDVEEGKAAYVSPFPANSDPPSNRNRSTASSDRNGNERVGNDSRDVIEKGQGDYRVEGDWEQLLARLKMALRSWRRSFDRQEWSGLASSVRRTRSSDSTSSSSAFRKLSPGPSIRSFASTVPRRRRILFIATFALISLYLFLAPSASSIARKGHLSALRSLSILTSSSDPYSTHSSSNKDPYLLNSLVVPSSRLVNKAKVLTSVSNPFGYINLIDPYAGGVFNPSVLVLPDAVGLGWRHLLVARGEEKYEQINGEDTRWEKVLGCFLLPMKRAHLELPYLARESELETLNLPAKRKVDYLRCHDPVYDQFIGPEDPRLFMTNDGQPLLIYSQTGRSPNICRALFIIDARMVIPGLTKALKRAGWNAPIEFSEQTDLIRENQFNIEKNWSPFLGENDELFFHVSLVPQQIYKYVPNLTLRPLDPLAPTHNCLTDVLGPDMNRVHLHHATPLLRATLCKRGECKPDVHNTVLIGMIHIKYHPLPYLHYVRRLVTWNVTSPYNYLSVSKPLTYLGTNQADPIFTVSMAWDHPTDRHGLGLNHGFLDDTVLLSFGVADYGSAYIDVLARDLLTDHELCSGVGGTSLWPRTSPAH